MQNNKTIIRKLYKLINPQIWQIFKENNVMVAGGTFERMLTGNDVNDLDVYFRSPQDAYNTIIALRSLKFAVTSKTTRSFLMTSYNSTPINIIIMKYFKDVEDVLSLFDYECCKAGYDFSTDTFTTSPMFWESLVTKKLIYNTSLYPIGALIRLNKYIKRGYDPDFTSVLRLYKDLKAIDDTNSEILEKQLGGLYGCTIDLKGLTIDQIIEKIDNTIVYERNHKFDNDEVIEDLFTSICTHKFLSHRNCAYDVSYCGDKIVWINRVSQQEIINKEPLTFPIILGKWIMKKDNKYCSFYDNSFEYKLDEIVEAKKPCGLYVSVEDSKNGVSYSDRQNKAWARILISNSDDIICFNQPHIIQIKKGKVISIKDYLLDVNNGIL